MSFSGIAYGIPGINPVFPVSEWQRTVYKEGVDASDLNNAYLDYAAFGTSTFVETMVRRVGDCVQIRATFTVGTVSGATAIIYLPQGLVIDQAKIQKGGPSIVGSFTGMRSASTALNTTSGVLFYTPQDMNILRFAFDTSTNTFTAASGNVVAESAKNLHVELLVPIKGWTF